MRGLVAVSFFVLAGCLAIAGGAPAAQRETNRPVAETAGPARITGIYLSTQYPAQTVRAGETATIDLALHNYHLPPQQLSLSVPQAAPGWRATILGGGQPVSAAMVGPDSEADLQLRLVPPPGAGQGDYHFVVVALGANSGLRLPITLTIGKQLPAKLKLSTSFPALRGTAATAFKYTVTVENDSGRDATINFTADAPRTFEATFSEAYGTQQITSIPIAAGKSKDIDMSVTVPHDTPAGDYKLTMHAKSAAASAELPLAVTVFGQAQLSLAGEGGRLSGEAYAGKASPLTVVVRNNGSAVARSVELTATAPQGWETTLNPETIPVLAAGKSQSVQMTLTPAAAAIAGDYQTTVRAGTADGHAGSADFRITVMTSTMWGIVGIAVIAVALLVVVFAIARYGRR